MRDEPSNWFHYAEVSLNPEFEERVLPQGDSAGFQSVSAVCGRVGVTVNLERVFGELHQAIYWLDKAPIVMRSVSSESGEVRLHKWKCRPCKEVNLAFEVHRERSTLPVNHPDVAAPRVI
jgi:hypothetical protein